MAECSTKTTKNNGKYSSRCKQYRHVSKHLTASYLKYSNGLHELWTSENVILHSKRKSSCFTYRQVDIPWEA